MSEEIVSVGQMTDDEIEVQEAAVVKREKDTTSALIEDPQSLVKFIENRNILLERALPLAMGVTRPNDWVKFGDKYRPTSSAAQRVMRRFAISLRNTRIEKTESKDEKGHYYTYVVYGEMSLPGGVDFIEAVGSATSRDKFFAKKQGEFRPLYEVSEANILKSARSNMITNGVTELLGIKNMSKADIEAAGINASEVQDVPFDKSSSRPSAPKPSSGMSDLRDPIDEGRRKQIVNDFTARLDYICFKESCSEDVVLEKYLPFSRPGKNGETFATRSIVSRFKKAKALKWLLDAIKQMENDHDMSGLKDYLSPGEGTQDEFTL